MIKYIEHRFKRHYEIYSSLKEGFESSKDDLNFGFYRSFKKGEKIKRGDLVKPKHGTTPYLFKGRCTIGGRTGYRFSERKKMLFFSTTCLCNGVSPFKKCFYRSGSFKSSNYLIFDEDIFKYIIDLPLNYQNPKVNVFLIKNIKDPYLLELLVNEYCNDGEQFQEYFLCLPHEHQKRVASKLNSLAKRIPNINQFLWKQGFEVGTLDHLALYKESNEDFIRYFKSRDDSEKRIILSDLLNCKETNEHLIRWLDENYSELIKNVGLDLCY